MQKLKDNDEELYIYEGRHTYKRKTRKKERYENKGRVMKQERKSRSGIEQEVRARIQMINTFPKPANKR